MNRLRAAQPDALALGGQPPNHRLGRCGTELQRSRLTLMRITHLRSAQIAGGAKLAVDRIADATSTLPDFTNQIVDLLPAKLTGRTLYGWFRYRFEQKLLGWSLSETMLPDYRVEKNPDKSADILHLHNLYGSGLRLEDVASLAKKTPVVWTLHDNRLLSWGNTDLLRPRRLAAGPAGHLIREFGRKCLLHRLARATKRGTVVFPSSWLKDQASAAGFLEKNQTAVIPNPLPRAFFDRQEPKLDAKIQMGFDPTKPVVTFVAWKAWKISGDMNKGYDVLEEAIPLAQRQRSFTFVVLGHDGALIPAGLGAVWIQPDGSQEQVIRLARATDVVVGASREEVLPTVIQEAQALGVPAVVPGATGYKDVVVDGVTGVHYVQGNALDFAEKMSELVGSPELRERLGRQAAERAAVLWHPDNVRVQYADLYRRVLGPKQAPVAR